MKKALKNFPSSSIAKVLILLLVFSLLIVLVFAGKRPYKGELQEGDISLVDIYAPYNFQYPGDVNEEKTNQSKLMALEGLLPVYDIKAGYWDEKRKLISDFFTELKKAKQLKDVDDNGRIDKLKEDVNIDIENEVLLPFLRGDIGAHQKAVINILNVLSSKMISDKATISKLAGDKKEELIVRNKSLNVECKIPRSDLYTKDTLKPIIEKELAVVGVTRDKLRKASAALLLSILDQNILRNKNEMDVRRKSLIDSLYPVYDQVLVKKNELIIQKGQKVSKTHILQLGQLTKKIAGRDEIIYLGGAVILFAIFILMIPVYLKTYRKKIYRQNKNLCLIGIITLLAAFLAKIITLSPLSSYFIPVAVAAMLLAILLDQSVAFMISIILSIFAAVITGNKFDIMLVSLAGGISAAYLIKGVRRRSQVLQAGLFVGISKFALICAIGMLNALEPGIFLLEACWGIASGIISAAIAMFLLPVFEFLFNITTDITLLELSDLNHPLLKKMVLSAPGTYHHSLVVGNLAEAACESIGANSLLARVGAYYHDIGKIGKVEYFSENEAGHKSFHERLAPSMSALIIQSHVKDGIELAKKYNMKKSIIDFIAQHHGTGLIYYFYQRALEKIGDEDKLKEEAFRYPGPRPQTKETAIVLLADAVEASSRTLNDPTPSRIKGHVQKIINNKFIDSQLDECELTLKDLNKISVAFSRILTGIFHTRVEYPRENKNKNKIKKKIQ